MTLACGTVSKFERKSASGSRTRPARFFEPEHATSKKPFRATLSTTAKKTGGGNRQQKWVRILSVMANLDRHTNTGFRHLQCRFHSCRSSGVFRRCTIWLRGAYKVGERRGLCTPCVLCERCGCHLETFKWHYASSFCFYDRFHGGTRAATERNILFCSLIYSS